MIAHLQAQTSNLGSNLIYTFLNYYMLWSKSMLIPNQNNDSKIGAHLVFALCTKGTLGIPFGVQTCKELKIVYLTAFLTF